MKLQANSRGIAALWLRAHAPTSDQADIASLAELFEGVWADGVKKGMELSIERMQESPTMSAAQASLEADVKELIRDVRKEQQSDEVDFDPTRP